MDKKITFTLPNGREAELKPKVSLYTVKEFMGNIMHGIRIELFVNNEETKRWEPFACITKNFGEFIGIKNSAYIDTNNYPFAEEMLSNYGIAIKTAFTKESGFCTYPLWVFKEEFLNSCDGAEQYKEYSREYDAYMKSFE